MTDGPGEMRRGEADPTGLPPGSGVIYVATGKRVYTDLALRSAASLKRSNPALGIDLFTDRDPGAGVFDRVHILSETWHRSRIDAMRLSRFARTMMIDCDTIVIGDLTPAFQVLDRFDIGLAYDYRPNGTLNHTVWRHSVPAAMPQFNGGVIVYRMSEAVDRFLADWSAAVKDHDIGRDQPTLRELLYLSDLRIVTLPEAFNLLKVDNIATWDQFCLAPRIIHSPHFHAEFDRYARAPDPVQERLGLRLSWRLRLLRGSDRALAAAEGRPVSPWGRAELRRGWLWILPRAPRRIWSALLRRLDRARSRFRGR